MSHNSSTHVIDCIFVQCKNIKIKLPTRNLFCHKYFAYKGVSLCDLGSPLLMLAKSGIHHWLHDVNFILSWFHPIWTTTGVVLTPQLLQCSHSPTLPKNALTKTPCNGVNIILMMRPLYASKYLESVLYSYLDTSNLTKIATASSSSNHENLPDDLSLLEGQLILRIELKQQNPRQ